MWIIDINEEEPITSHSALDELNRNQTTRGKSKEKISPYRSKSYQRTNIEEISSIFDQVRPVVSHLEFHLPNKPPTPKNIGEGLKGFQRQYWKEALFVKYYKNKKFTLIFDSTPIKYLPEGTKVLRSLISPYII